MKKSILLASIVIAASCISNAMADYPTLSLEQTGGSATSESFSRATLPQTVSLDLHLNTAGYNVDGLQFYISVTPSPVTAVLPTYASAASIGAGQGPFASGLIEVPAPTPGEAVNATADTILFLSTAGDFSASSNYNVLTYSFNTGSLASGSYVFDAIGQGFTDSPNLVFDSTFDQDNPFTLTVTPEPGSACAVLACAALAGLRQRRRYSK